MAVCALGHEFALSMFHDHTDSLENNKHVYLAVAHN